MMPRSKLQPVGTFDADWQGLAQAGQAPELGGRSAEEARRNERRKRPLMPSERRRRERKLTLTLSPELLHELRRICAERGHVDEEGKGKVVSHVVENLLWLAVGAYRDGLVEVYEEQVIDTVERLRWKA